jgi:hypothetical protein
VAKPRLGPDEFAARVQTQRAKNQRAGTPSSYNLAANQANAVKQANAQAANVQNAIGTRAPTHGVGGGVVSRKTPGDPLDNPNLKAITKPPGVTVTTPRRAKTQADFDKQYPVGKGYDASKDRNAGRGGRASVIYGTPPTGDETKLAKYLKQTPRVKAAFKPNGKRVK